MNKNREYFEFVDCLKKEVQHVIKDWEADAMFQPASDSEPEDYLLVKMPAKGRIGVHRFHLEDIYRDLICKGSTMEEIMNEIREALTLGHCVSGLEQLDEVDCYEKIRDSLILRPLNYDANAGNLDQGVFYRIGDVALALYINMGNMEGKYVSGMVKSELLPIWEKKKEELMETAIRNTYRVFPPRLINPGAAYSNNQTEAQEFMYTDPDIVKIDGGCIFVTTESNINGAISIFMPGVAKRLGELIGNDLYIGFLCSDAAAVHDSSLTSLEDIKAALRFQNREFDGEDFLSDKVYFYSRERDRIEEVG